MNVFWRCEPRVTTCFSRRLSTPTLLRFATPRTDRGVPKRGCRNTLIYTSYLSTMTPPSPHSFPRTHGPSFRRVGTSAHGGGASPTQAQAPPSQRPSLSGPNPSVDGTGTCAADGGHHARGQASRKAHVTRLTPCPCTSRSRQGQPGGPGCRGGKHLQSAWQWLGLLL